MKLPQNVPRVASGYNEALCHPNLLRAKQAAKYLGVALNWLRKNVPPSEAHPCYTVRYTGGRSIAYFWHRDYLDVLTGPELESAKERMRGRLP